MKELRTARLLLRPFRGSDYDDLYEFLSKLRDYEFEGYPGITYENGREHLDYSLASDEFFAVELAASGKVIGNIYCGKRDFGARGRLHNQQGLSTQRLRRRGALRGHLQRLY